MVWALIIPPEFEQHFPIKIGICEVTLFEDVNGQKCVPATILQWSLLEDSANNNNLAPEGSVNQELWQWGKTKTPQLVEQPIPV